MKGILSIMVSLVLPLLPAGQSFTARAEMWAKASRKASIVGVVVINVDANRSLFIFAPTVVSVGPDVCSKYYRRKTRKSLQ